MGPRKTPRRERGPGDYTQIGQRGRRTGTTLPDTGVRDKHGMEPIPSFSSPERLPIRSNGLEQVSQNDKLYEVDENADVEQSTLMEPLEILKSARSGRKSIPRSLSPRKSQITGSPRRSVGLLSPSKNLLNSSPTRPLSQKPPNRQLDFSRDRPDWNRGISPQKTLWEPPATAFSIKKGKNKRPFDLSGLGGDDENAGEANKDENEHVKTIDPSYDDYVLQNGDGEPLGESPFEISTGDEHIEQSIELEEDDAFGPAGASLDTLRPSSDHTTKKNHEIWRAPEAPMFEQELSPSPVLDSASDRQGGRMRNKSTEIFEDSDATEVPSTSQSKVKQKGKKTSKPKAITKSKPVAPKKARTDSVRAESIQSASFREDSAQPGSRQEKFSKTGSTRGGSAHAGSVGRTFIVSRSETPATDDGVYKTRSGRTSYKPLAAWRGEKAVYGQRTDRDTPGSLTDIIRTDEIQMPPPATRRKPARRKVRATSELTEISEESDQSDEEVFEDDGEVDPWETETGIKYGMVMAWDQEAQRWDEDRDEETELAYAADAIALKDVPGADFQLAKTLTTNFFGCGLIRLPPRSVKRMKNARKMQMVFFVHTGRLTVTIANEEFSIGKGGQWLVPRGNFYGIVNESYKQDALIFFAQGNEFSSSKLLELEAAGQLAPS